MKTIKVSMIVFVVATIVTWNVSAASSTKEVVKAKEYTIVVASEGDRKSIITEGRSGYHCNTLYPWKAIIRAESTEFTMGKKEASVFEEKRVVFILGDKRVKEVTLKLSVCNDKQCIMKTEKVKI